jgi:hypothetical protein
MPAPAIPSSVLDLIGNTPIVELHGFDAGPPAGPATQLNPLAAAM